MTTKLDFVVATKEVCLKVNAEGTKYILISRDQNAGHNHNVKIDNKTLNIVEQFRYLEDNANKLKLLHEETESRLKSGIDCCHSVQNLL